MPTGQNRHAPRWREVDRTVQALRGAIESSRAGARLEYAGMGPKLTAEEADALRTTLPTEPCFRCGDRGWCRHRPLAP